MSKTETTTADELERMVRGRADDLVLMERGYWPDGDAQDYTARELVERLEDYGSPFLAWLNDRLEVKLDPDGSIAILVSHGGPNIWVTLAPTGSHFDVVGYWGSDRSRVSVECVSLSDELRLVMEERNE